MNENQNKRLKSIAIVAAIVMGIVALAFGISKFVLSQKDEDKALNFNEYRIQTSEISFSPKDTSLGNDDYTGGEVKVEIEPGILNIANVGKTGNQLMTIQYQLTELNSQTGVDENQWVDYTGPFYVDHNVKVNTRLVSVNDENFKGPVTSKDVTQIAVAKIGSTTYPTLADAITAWTQLSSSDQSNSTIEMLASTTESVTIPAGENIKLDLKGFNVTGEDSETAITVNGNLNLIDSGKTEQGSTTYGSVTSEASSAVQVASTGTLTLGTNESEPSVNTNGPVINGGANSNGVVVAEGGNLNFYDGKITAPNQVGTHKAINVNNTPVGEENSNLIVTPEGYKLSINVENGREIATLVKTVTVSFDCNGGTPATIESIEAATGKAYNTYATWPSDPTREGYTFGGWKVNDTVVTASTTVTEQSNHTLTADWVANTYTINYNANTGTGSLPSTPATYGADVTLPDPSTNITKTGYTFKGWSTNQNANPDTDTLYTAGQTVSNLTTTNNETVTLYAIWKDETLPNNEAPTGTSTTNTVTVTSAQTDSGSGIDENTIQYSIYKDGAWTAWQDSPTFENLAGNTEYRIKTRAKDQAGNGYTESQEGTVTTKTIQNATVTFHKDTATGDEITPEASSTSKEHAINNSTIVLKVEPAETGTTTVTITDPSGTSTTYNLGTDVTLDQDGTYHISIPNTTTGTYTITTSTTDGTNTATDTSYIYVDRTNPTITETVTTTTNSVTAVAGEADVGAGVDTVTYTLVESDGTTPAQDANNQVVAANSTGIFTGLKDNHDYKVVITVTDKAGNTTTKTVNASTQELTLGTLTFKAAGESSNFTPNTEDPNAQGSQVSKVWKNKDVEVTIADQGTGTTTYTYTKVGGSESAPISSTTNTIPTENGDYVVTVTSTDGVNTKTQNYYFSIDKTLSTITMNPNTANIDVPQASSTANVATTATITEAESGIASVRYAITTDNLNAPTTEWTTATASNTVAISASKPAGTYYVWTEVTDNAGNVSVATSGAFNVKYVVEFDMNIDKTAVEIISGETIKTAESTITIAPAQTREGYLFKGWALDENALTATHSAGAECTVTESTRFYAVWSEIVASTTISGTTTYFDSVQGAIDFAGSSIATVTLLKDEIIENVSVVNGQNITLDTNGKTLKSTTNTVTNGGTLIITGNGTIQSTSESESAINNSGILEVSAGTIKAQKVAINNTGTSTNENNPSVKISGGNIHSTANYAIANQSTGNVVLNSGNITGSAGIKNDVECTGTIIVNGGSINVSGHGIRNYVGNVEFNDGEIITGKSGDGIWTSSTGNILVTGGKITGGTNGVVTTGMGTITITGGTIEATTTDNAGNAVQSKGKLTIGNKDDNNIASNESPVLIGSNRGIVKTNGTEFNFYDGIVKAPEGKTITGTVTDTPEGYRVTNGTEEIGGTIYETAYLEKYIQVTLDANGGTYELNNETVSTSIRTYSENATYGELPIATREGYTFKGWGKTQNTLPDEYQEVEYIRFTGDQYIDTGVVPTNHTTEVKFDFEEYNNGEHLFGTSSGAGYYHFTAYSNKYDWGRNGSEKDGGTWTTGIHTLIYNGADYSVQLDNDVLGASMSITSSTNLLIGDRGTRESLLQGKIYYFKITDKSTGDVVRNFVPCYRKSDGKIGLYDIINGVFYTNNGTGTFEKGADKTDRNDFVTSETTLISNENHTIYAIWEKKPIVTLDANGGTYELNGETVNTSTRTYEPNSIYGELPIATREGYTFKGWAKTQRTLPSEYQEVEYIRFTGSQYIDTGVVPTNHTTEVKFDFEEYDNDEHLFGTSSGANYYHFTEYNNSYYWGRYGSEKNGGTWTTGVHTLIYNGVDYLVQLDNDVLGASMRITSSTNLLIGDRGSRGSLLQGKIYYFKITDKSTGDVVRNFVPCYRKSDGKIGLYDIINGVFYTNNGTGTFEKGADKTDRNDFITSETTLISNVDHSIYAIWEKKPIVTLDANGGTYELNGETVNTSTRTYEPNSIYGELPIATREGYTFKGWAKTQRTLPSEYQEVEYIRFTGSQYIDTGVVPTNHTTEVKFDFEEYDNDEHLFGTSSGSRYYHFTEYDNSYYWGRNGSEKNGGTWTTGVHTLIYNGVDYLVQLDNDVLGASMRITSSTNLLIGDRGSRGSLLQGKIYYFKITDKSTGDDVRDFVPCYRKSDGEIGLYDIINGVFYTNNGTGTFEKGTDKTDGNDFITSETTLISNVDHTLYASWTINNYSITYSNLNGGSYVAGTPQPTSYTIEDEVTLPTLEKTGFTFLGWKEVGAADNTAVTALPAGTTGNKTLEAVFAAGTSGYTLTHYVEKANGTGYDQYSTEFVSATTGDTITLSTQAITIANTTYQKATDGAGNEVTTITVASDGSSAVNVYYTRNTFELTVTAGTNTTSATGSGTYKWGQEVNISAAYENVSGYDYSNFTWTTTDTSILANVAATSTTVTMPAATTTVTATANRTATNYSIEYNLNDGTVASENPTTYTVESNAITLNNPTKTGYTFAGWTGTGLSEATQTVTIPQGSTGNRLYTATWTADEYTITYNLDGGTVTGTNPGTYTIESNAITLNNPTKTGYTFAGWTGTDLAEATSVVTIAQGSTGNRSYTATWTANTYTVTLDANNGEVSPTSIEVTYNNNYGTLPTPTRTGYTFNGWKLNGNTIESTTVVTTASAHTLIADWTVNTHTLTYDYGTNGGQVSSSDNTTTQTESKDYGTAIDLTKTAYKANSSFLGWAETSSATEGLPTSTILTMPDANKTLYAIYANMDLSDSTITIDLSDTENLSKTVTISGSNYGTVTATSSDSETATASLEGNTITITGVSTGTANVTVTSSVTDINGDPITKTITVNVIKTPTAVTVSPATATITVPGGTNNTTALTATITPSGTTDQDTITWSSSNDAVATVDNQGNVTGVTRGTAIITATTANGKSASATITVEGIKVAVPTPTNLTYNGEEQTGVTAGTGYTVTNNKGTNADTYTATASLTDTTIYEWADGTTENKPVQFTIAPKQLTASADSVQYSKTYDGTTTVSNGTITLTGVVSGDTVTASGTFAYAQANASDSDININVTDITLSGADSANYTVTPTTLTVTGTINKAVLTATYTGQEIYYGETPDTTRITVTGFVNDETAATAAGYVAPTINNYPTAQGTHSLTPSGGSATNYTFNYVSGNLVINPRGDVTIELDQDTFVYDGNAKTPTVTLKDNNNEVIDPSNYTVAYQDNTDAGTAKVVITFNSGSGYTGNPERTFTITKADRTISDISTVYVGLGANKQVNFTYTGEDVTATATSGSTATATVSLTDGTSAGTVTITGVQAGNAVVTINVPESANYNQASKNVNVTVTDFTIAPRSTTTVIGGTVTITPTIMPSEAASVAAANEISWSSSNTNIATVSAATTNNAAITVTGVADGTARITATLNGQSKTATVFVESNYAEYESGNNTPVRYYTTLANAFTNATSGNTIKPLKSLSDLSMPALSSNKTIILDLDEFEVELSNQIDNYGDLTITGTTGKITSATTIVSNEGGDLTINGGILTTTSESLESAIYNTNLGTVTIEGGTIISGACGIYDEDGTISVSDGIIVGETGINSLAGTITINGGEISGEGESDSGFVGTGISVGSGSVSISGNSTSITGNLYGVKIGSSSGSATITGGTIFANGGTDEATEESFGRGVYVAPGGTLIVGTNEATPSVSTTVPQITGSTHGVYNSGIFNFYDGVIVGRDGAGSAIYGSVNAVPTGYGVQKTADREIAVLLENAILVPANYAEYNGNNIVNYYGTLNDAFTNATSGRTIKVLNNVTETEEVASTMEATTGTLNLTANAKLQNKTLTLDLAGKTITTAKNITTISVQSTGNLTILDSVGSGMITNSNGTASSRLITNDGVLTLGGTNDFTIRGSSSNVSQRILVNSLIGTMNLNKGIVEQTGTLNSSVTSVRNIIVNRNTINVDGATIRNTSETTSTNDRGIDHEGDNGTLTISSGTISTKGDAVFAAASTTNANDPRIVITGGTIISTGYDAVVNAGTGLITIGQATGSTTNISGARFGVYNFSKGSIEVSNGTITGDVDGIYTSGAQSQVTTGNATVTVTGGTIKGKRTGINVVDSSIVTIGNNSNAVDTTSPVIISTDEYNDAGHGIGVYVQGTFENETETGTEMINGTATLNFYDGIIKTPRTGYTIYREGTETTFNTPTGYYVRIDSEEIEQTTYETAYLAIVNYAEYNGDNIVNYYGTLADAFTNATSGSTIKVLNNVTETTTATIATGKTLTLDMNGKTTTLNGDETNNSLIENNGTLTITDTTSATNSVTVADGTNVNKAGTLTSNRRTITNNGTLTVNGDVEINSTNTGVSTVVNGALVSGQTTVGATLTVNKGIISSTGFKAIHNGDVAKYSNGTVTINGGTITSSTNLPIDNWGITNVTSGKLCTVSESVIYNRETGQLSASGGTLSSGNQRGITNYGTVDISGTASITSKGISVVNYNASNNTESSPAVKITGGTIKSTAGNVVTNSASCAGCIVIKGGNIISETTGSQPAVLNRVGKIIIEGGNISTINTVAVQQYMEDGVQENGSIEIRDGIISSTNYKAVYVNSGEVIITGGEISGGTYGAQVASTGTLTLGTNESTPSVNTSTPSITGTTNGVVRTNGTFNFYDGIIKGSDGEGSAISGTVTAVPIGYVIQKTTATSGNVTSETAILVPANYAEYNGNTYVKGYTTLAEAFTSATSGNTIKVMQNTTENIRADLVSGKTLTLDTNEKTISFENVPQETSDYCGIMNEGNLIITGTGTISIDTPTTEQTLEMLICNQGTGTLNVKGGTLQANPIEFVFTIYDRTKTYDSNGNPRVLIGTKDNTVNTEQPIIHGIVYAEPQTTDESIGLVAFYDGIVYTDGGTYADSISAVYSLRNISDGINDIGVDIAPDGYVLFAADLGNNSYAVALVEYGLVVTYNGNGATRNIPAPASVPIGGGTYTITTQIPARDGYKFIGWNEKQDGTGTSYTAGQNINVTSSMTIYAQWEEANYGEYNGSTWIAGYTTLAEAFTNATSGRTIKPLKGTESTPLVETVAPELISGKTLTLNMNGKYVKLNNVVIANNGTITVNGTGKLTSTTRTIDNNNVLNVFGSVEINNTASGASTLLNNGTLTVNNGTISSTNYRAITNDKDTAKLVVNGGSIIAKNVAIYNNKGTLATTSSPTVKVTGGTIESTNNVTIYNNATGMIYLTGGTIKQQNANSAVANQKEGFIQVSGATITHTATNGHAITSTGGQVKITSGKVSTTGGVVEGTEDTATNNKRAISTTGTFSMSGGTVTSNYSEAVYVSGSSATVTGGTIQKGADINGKNHPGSTFQYTGTGTATISGGTIQTLVGSGSATVNKGETSGTLEIKGTAKVLNNGIGYAVVNSNTDAASTSKVIITAGTITASSKNAIRNYASGEIEINGGTITTNSEGDAVHNASKGKITMTAGTVETKGAAAFSIADGELIITGGTIKGVTQGVYLGKTNTPVFTLGTDDGTVTSSATATPSIEATSGFGVEVNNGTFNFYDGVVKGTVENGVGKSISKEPDALPTGYLVQKTSADSQETAILAQANYAEYTASNSTTPVNYYLTLSDAFNGGQSGNIIRPLKTQTDSTVATVAEGKNLKLDLQGYKLTLEYVITNNGTLDIYSSKNGGGILSSANNVVTNNNTFTLNGTSGSKTITLTNTSTEVGAHVINNLIGTATLNANATLTYSNAITTEGDAGRYTVYNRGTTYFQGATIKNTVSGNARDRGIMNITEASARTIVTSGSIETGSLALNNNAGTGATTDDAAIVISGGTIKSTVGVAVYNQQTAMVYVSGGTIIGKTIGIQNTKAGKITVTGGTISSNTDEAIKALSGPVSVSGNSTIINGKTYGITKTTGTVTVDSGTVKGATAGIYLNGGTATINGGSVEGNTDGIYVNKGTVNAYAGTIKGISGSGISNGSKTEGNVTNYVIGKTSTTGPSISGTKGIFAEGDSTGKATVTINSGTITSTDIGIDIRKTATLTVNGGTIQATGHAIYDETDENTTTTPTIKITGGTIKATGNNRSIIENKSKDYILITGGTLEGTQGIRGTGSPVIEVTGGTIEATVDVGIRCYINTKLIIGKNETTPSVSTTSPQITGKLYGITRDPNAIVYFYDGRIIGKNGTRTALPDGYTQIPTGYGVNKTLEGDVETAILTPANYVEYSGKTSTSVVRYYTTLQEALSNVTSGNRIRVLKTQNDTSTPTLAAEKDILIDLYGNTLTLSKAITNNGTLVIYNSSSTEANINSSAENTITNKGTLSINKESSSNQLTITNTTVAPANRIIVNNAGKTVTLNKNVTLTYSNPITQPATAANRYVITNSGILNINGATITNKPTSTQYDRGISNANAASRIIMTSGNIDTYGSSIVNESGTGTDTPTIDISGTATGTKITSENNNAIYSETAGTINISGGTITTSRITAINNSSTGTVNISGSTVINSETHGIYNKVNGTINVSGGTINGGTNGLYNEANGIINVTGGIITGNNGIGIRGQTGTVTVGTNETTPSVNTTVPSISGTTYGVQMATSGTFNFYDGVIKGAVDNGEGKSISKQPNATPTGYGVQKTINDANTQETAILVKEVEITYDNNFLSGDIMEAKRKTEKFSYATTSGTTSSTTDVYADNGKDLVWTATKAGTKGPYMQVPAKLEVGKVYTYSVYLKASKDIKLSVGPQQGGTKNVNVTQQWQRFTHTFTATDTTNTGFVMYALSAAPWEIDDVLYVRSMELEQTDSLNTYNETKLINEILNPATPTREGYTFDGWYTDPVGGTKITSSSTTPGTSATYYAHWIINNYQEVNSSGTSIKYYPTLQQAFDGVTSKNTIKLLNDWTENSWGNLKGNKTVTFNTNGKTLTFSDNYRLEASENSTLTVNGAGKIISNNDGLLIRNNAKATLGKVTIEAGASGVLINDAANLVVNGATINSTYNGLEDKSLDGNSITIDVKSGTINSQGNAIATHYNNNSTINISGGTITGNTTGIFTYRTNNINITGGTITAETQSGIHAYGSPTIKITGGKIIAENEYALRAYHSSDVTIGKDDGTVSVDTPQLTGKRGIAEDPDAVVRFYDGKIVAKSGAGSYMDEDGTTITPDNYGIVTKLSGTGNTTETATLAPKLITNGALTTLNAKYNTGTWNGTHDSSATTWTALSGLNGTKTAGTWGDNYLHATGKSVTLGSMNPSPSETIQATFSMDSVLTTDQWVISNSIGTKGETTDTRYGGGIYIDKTEHKIKGRISLIKDNTPTIVYPDTGVVVEPGKVYDVALTYNGTTLKMYVNGVQKYSTTQNKTIRETTSSTVMTLGSHPSGSSPFTGNIYSAAVYNRALTAAEILHNAKAGFTTAGEDISTIGTASTTSTTQNALMSSGKSLMSLAKSRFLSVNTNAEDDSQTDGIDNNELNNKLEENVDNSTSQETEDNSNTDASTQTEEKDTKEETITVEKTKVVQISGTDYSTISEAIMAANSGDTIKVLEDLNLTEEVVIDTDKVININLNGKTITSTSNNTINNKGTLTITGNGIIKNEVENGVVIYNTGILNIENGVITTTANGGKAVFNDNSNGTFEDTYKKPQDFMKAFIKKSNECKGSFNMKGGKIVTEGIGSIGIYNVNNSVSVVTGGIIETRNYASKGVYNDSTFGIENAKVIISDEDSIVIYNANAAKSCIIKESEITVEAEEIEDYELIKNTDQFKEELEKMKPSYGIYNDSDSEVLVETATIKVERLKGVGIFNNAKGTITLGYDESIDDENIELDTASPIVYAIADNTTSIINSKEGTINFYDGKVLTKTSIKNIITDVLKNYEIYEELSSNIISTTLRLIEETSGAASEKSQETESSSESKDVVNSETNSNTGDKSNDNTKTTDVSTPSQNVESDEKDTSNQENGSSEESNVKPVESTESAENGNKSANENSSIETDGSNESVQQGSDK